MMEKKENNKRMQMAHKGQAQNANGPGREPSVHSVFSSF